MTAQATRQIEDRLAEIEAAIHDLRSSIFGQHKVRDLEPGGMAHKRYVNRVQHVLLLLNHIQGDASRAAKHKGLHKNAVSKFVARSKCVRLCERAADTHKHGLGGREKNGTAPTSLILTVKNAHLHKDPKDALAIVEGLLISDAEEGSFVSQSLIQGAVLEWAEFLGGELQIECSDWVIRCFPPTTSPKIMLSPSAKTNVPLGAQVVVEIPEAVRNSMSDLVRKARDGK